MASRNARAKGSTAGSLRTRKHDQRMIALAAIVVVASAGLLGTVFLVLNTLCNTLLAAPVQSRNARPRGV
jgi:hypothetical protein